MLTFFFQRNKRQYFICHGTIRIPENVMQSATGADVVYFKEFEHGILYSLYFEHANRKQHGTIERSIERLDGMLKKRNVTERTHFTSLTETGKVKSFGGRDRHDDYHFCEIFNVSAPKIQDGRQYQLQPGVASFLAPSREQVLAEELRDDGCKQSVQELGFDGEDALDSGVDAALGVRCVEGKKAIIARLTEEAAASRAEISQLKEEYGVKDDEIARLKKQIEEHGAKDEEIARLKEDDGAKNEEISRLKEENGAKDAENVRLKKELGAKDEELARLKVQIEEAKSSSARTVVTANLRMEVHVLEEKVSKYCRENQTLLAEKTRIVQESWDRKTRVEELTRQLAGERESNLNVQNAMDEKHRKEVEALRRQISATKPEHYDQRMAEVTAELGAANRQLDLVRAEVARLRSSGEVRVVNKVVEVEQVFDKMLEMAQSMSQLGDNGGGEIDSGFQNLAKEAMLMLLSGTPGSKSDHLNKAQPIVDRFWSVYTKAARNEQEARTPYVRPQDLMTKQRKRKGDASL